MSLQRQHLSSNLCATAPAPDTSPSTRLLARGDRYRHHLTSHNAARHCRHALGTLPNPLPTIAADLTGLRRHLCRRHCTTRTALTRRCMARFRQSGCCHTNLWAVISAPVSRVADQQNIHVYASRSIFPVVYQYIAASVIGLSYQVSLPITAVFTAACRVSKCSCFLHCNIFPTLKLWLGQVYVGRS